MRSPAGRTILSKRIHTFVNNNTFINHNASHDHRFSSESNILILILSDLRSEYLDYFIVWQSLDHDFINRELDYCLTDSIHILNNDNKLMEKG